MQKNCQGITPKNIIPNAIGEGSLSQKDDECFGEKRLVQWQRCSY